MSRFFFLVFLFFPGIIVAETHPLPTSGTLLWRISGKGLQYSSYLYGTMHTRDARVFHFSDSVLNCFMRCRAFAMELKLDELNREDVISNMMMDSGQTIENYLSKNQYDSLALKIQAATGLPMSLFERMKPIYIATMLSQNEILNDTISKKNLNPFFLDEYFEEMAKHSGKKINALEILQTQLDVFNFLTIKQQVEMLMNSVREENSNIGLDTFINHYINGELEILINNQENEMWSADFVNQILYKRNKGMADTIESLIKAQSTFAAFGAAHLTGDSGVISLLRKKGFTVEPVEANYNDISKEGWLYVYPCSVIAVPMPGIPQYLIDTLPSSKIIYQKWISSQSNNYVVAHFNNSVSINKKVLEEFVGNEIKNRLSLVRVKGVYATQRNIKAYYLNKKSANGTVSIVENGNEKIVAIVFNELKVDSTEMNRFLFLVRYKISSVIPN